MTVQKVEAWVKEEKIDYVNRQQRYLKAILLITHLLSKPLPANGILFDMLISYYVPLEDNIGILQEEDLRLSYDRILLQT